MKNYVSPKEWADLEEALMKAQVPYYVSFNSEIGEDMETITYNRRITIEPFTIQTEVKV